MREFFHYTDPGKVSSILAQGLKPGIEVEEVHYYCSVENDNTKIYLIKGLDKAKHYLRTMRFHKSLLKINLPDEHPLERDYEQFLIYLRMPEETLSRNLMSLGVLTAPDTHEELFRDFLKHYGVEFTGDASEENVIHHLNMITDEKWDEQSPCYATRKSILSEYIELFQL